MSFMSLLSRLIVTAILGLCSCIPLSFADEGSFGKSAAQFIGSYLLGKVVDGIWDNVTGKPNVEELQARISHLEASLGGSSPSLDALRNNIHTDMSFEEYQRLVNIALPGVANILSDHERRLQALEAANSSISNGALRLSSYWNHNGSKMGLLVDGNQRMFVYVEPRLGMANLVQPGTVLFSGTTDSKSYNGIARRFSRGLPPIEYHVSGPIGSSGTRVILFGKAVIRNSDGSIKKTFDDTLVFDYISKN